VTMLEISDLNAGYGGNLILRDLDCNISKGKITALMGRNGMGKTTFLRTIMHFIQPVSGNIFFEGHNLRVLETAQIARLGIGYVPQGREIFDDFSVEENLKLGLLGQRNKDNHQFKQVYNWFPILEERKTQKAGSFSGGQQQILAIARALISNPRLLLLDEPTEGIQPNLVHEIGTTLANIAKETKMAVLLVEQNVDMVRTTAETIMFMDNGNIKETCHITDIQEDDRLLNRYLSLG
jgi:urea transport system ATP-binding protein